MKSTAKSLITGQLNEAPGDGTPPGGGPGGPPRRPGGPPRRMERPGGPGGPGGPEQAGGMSGKERTALKDLIILDLLNALGNDPFYTEIANTALKGDPITPQVVRHLMDEAPKYADKMPPEVNELMGKIAAMPMN